MNVVPGLLEQLLNGCEGLALRGICFRDDDHELVFGQLTGELVPALDVGEQVARNQGDVIELCPSDGRQQCRDGALLPGVPLPVSGEHSERFEIAAP